MLRTVFSFHSHPPSLFFHLSKFLNFLLQMPQPDPESPPSSTSVDANSKDCPKIASDEEAQVNASAAAAAEPDFPPESFWLSKDAEYDWFDRNAIYERKDSGGRGAANLNPSSNSNSQRFSVSLKSKACIIGLPRPQKAAFVDSKRRTCRPASVRLFPTRSNSVGKSSAPVAEPGSPNVSCIGRVRSKRCRRRSKRKEKPMERSRSGGEKKGSGGEKKGSGGFYRKVMSMFRSRKGHRKASRSASRKVVEEDHVVVELRRRSVSVRVREVPGGPGLGELRRFASGRRNAGD